LQPEVLGEGVAHELTGRRDGSADAHPLPRGTSLSDLAARSTSSAAEGSDGSGGSASGGGGVLCVTRRGGGGSLGGRRRREPGSSLTRLIRSGSSLTGGLPSPS